MNQMAPGGNSEFDRLFATITKVANGKRDWLQIANAVAIVRDKKLWRGKYRSETDWMEAAAAACDVTPNTLRRFLTSAQFLFEHAKSLVKNGAVVVVRPNGKDPAEPVMATVELIKRMHDVSPSSAQSALDQHLNGQLSYRALKRQYDTLFDPFAGSGKFNVVFADPPFGAEAFDSAKISSRRAHRERNELGSLVRSHLETLSGVPAENAKVKKVRFTYVTPDAVAIGTREAATPFIDAFDYKRLPKGITQASVSKLISDATFAATFFRRYWLVLDATADDASEVVSAADALDIENLGVALIQQDSQDNLEVLRTPSGAPVPDRQEMALLAVG